MQLVCRAAISLAVVAVCCFPTLAEASIAELDLDVEYPQQDIDQRRDERDGHLKATGAGIFGVAAGLAKRNPLAVASGVTAAAAFGPQAWQAQQDVDAMEDHNYQAKARRRDRAERERPDPWIARSAKRSGGCRARGQHAL